MTLYDELIARGLIAQVTNEDEIKNMINNGKATFYIGFDCTADAGAFLQSLYANIINANPRFVNSNQLGRNLFSFFLYLLPKGFWLFV